MQVAEQRERADVSGIGSEQGAATRLRLRGAILEAQYRGEPELRLPIVRLELERATIARARFCMLPELMTRAGDVTVAIGALRIELESAAVGREGLALSPSSVSALPRWCSACRKRGFSCSAWRKLATASVVRPRAASTSPWLLCA